MIKENKILLLQDISAKLPYGVKASYYGTEEEKECIDIIEGVNIIGNSIEITIGQYGLPIEEIKPYLFPISSMTLEQFRKLQNLFPSGMYYGYDSNNNLYISISDGHDDDCYYSSFLAIQDWLDSHHIDYRGLITRGLALDATNKGIYE